MPVKLELTKAQNLCGDINELPNLLVGLYSGTFNHCQPGSAVKSPTSVCSIFLRLTFRQIVPPVLQQRVEPMHSCSCVIGWLCVDASDLAYNAHFVCLIRYLCLA